MFSSSAPRKKLQSAIEKRDFVAIRDAIAMGADVNGRISSITPLMLAAAEGEDDEYLTFLLQSGADVNLQDRTGTSALMFASMHGYEDTAAMLLDAGASIDLLDRKGLSALHHATQANIPAVIRLLASHGANVNLRTSRNETPLDIAFSAGFIEAADALIQTGSMQDQTLAASGKKAAQFAHWLAEVVPLFAAVLRRDLISITRILDMGTNPDPCDARDRTPLRQAIDMRHGLPIVKVLVEHGASVEAITPNAWPPICAAACRGVELTRYLLENGADITARTAKRQYSAFEYAAEKGDLEVLRLLVEHAAARGIPINLSKAIEVATARGHQEAAEYLLGAG